MQNRTTTVNNNQDKWWSEMYNKPFIVTTENKLRSFQYQILRRSLVTNKFLYLCKIKDNDSCYFCNNSCETIEHLFYECKNVQDFWRELARTLQHVFNMRKYIVKKYILLGARDTENDTILNFLFNQMLEKRTSCNQFCENSYRLL